MLSRTLGPGQLIAAGAGCIVGAGIFLSTPGLAYNYGGPALLIGYLVAGLGCALTALCYAEFAALQPDAGSAYGYARATLGDFAGWMVGCALFLEYTFGSAAVAKLWMERTDYAVYVVIAFSVLLALGIRISAGVNSFLVIAKVGTLLLFVGWICWWAFGHPAEATLRWNHFALPADDWRLVAGMAVFSYLGFESVSTLGLESRNPQRDLPIGVLGSLALATVIYLAVVYAFCLGAPIEKSEGLRAAARATGAGWLDSLIAICVRFALSTVVLVMMMGQSRIFYSMATDRLLPGILANVNPSTQVPVAAIALTGLTTALAVYFVPLGQLYNLAVIGTLLAFCSVAVAVPLLRIQRPNVARPFRVPMVWLTAGGALLVDMVLMSRLLVDVATGLGIWLAVSLLLWLFARRRSR